MAVRSGVIVSLGALLVGVGVAGAQTDTSWLVGEDGLWSEPANWSDGVPANDGETFNAIIDVDGVDGEYVVTLDFDAQVDGFELINADATVDGLGTSELEVLEQFVLSDSRLQAFGALASRGTLAFESAICDELCDIPLSHTGSAVTWQGTGDIDLVGSTTFAHGPGSTFFIQNASSIVLDGPAVFLNEGTIEKASPGTTTVDGSPGGVFANPGTLDVGAGVFETDALDLPGDTLAEGTWIVRDGATLDFVGQSVVTNQAAVTIDGAGSAFDALTQNLAVNAAAGSLAVDGGFDLTTPGDFTNNGLADVGPGSTLTVGGDYLNFDGAAISVGVLDLEGTFRFTGAAVSVIDADITLDGPGSAIVDEDGADGLTPLSMITPGGALTIANGRDLTVSEPVLDVSGDLTIGPASGADQSILDAAMDVVQPSGTTLLDEGVLMVGGVYSLSGTGQLRGNGTVVGPLTSAGRIRPGLSAGQITVQPGLLQQAGGTVEIELGGPEPVIGHDVLNVFGVLQFEDGQAGTMEVVLIDGFEPRVGDQFDVITFKKVLGQFQDVVAPNLPCGQAIQTDYLAPEGVVRLTVVEDCVADCNDDGMVDVTDFLCFQMEWQEQLPCGDCNGDGQFDVLDFVCFQGQWQEGCP